MECRLCKSSADLVLDLGFHAPSDSFLTEEDLGKPEKTYPLELYYCETCGLVQIGYVVDKHELFTQDYPYTTGINEGGIKHFHDFARSVIKDYAVDNTDFVVDVGGNDGTLLQPFFDIGCQVLNVDPSGVESSVPVWKAFWDMGTATAIRKRYGQARVILATNCFAHVADLHDFIIGVDVLLADDGVFVVESPCLEDMLKFKQFDQIYHEHLYYYNERPIKFLVEQYNMELKGVKHNGMHGGSNRYFITKVH